MQILKKYRAFLLSLNEISGKQWNITLDGLTTNQNILIFCPETLNYSCFFSVEYKQIFLTKEIFPEFLLYSSCPYFAKVKMINFSTLFEFNENGFLVDNLIDECDLSECSFNELVKNVVMTYKHRNEKFNSICPANKNIIIYEQFDQLGLNCSFLKTKLLNQ